MMGTLHNSALIVRVGRNQYKKVEKEPKKGVFTGVYSHAALQVIQYMQEQFPLLSYRVWELSWLNEFFNHQLAHNLIFVEVEKEKQLHLQHHPMVCLGRLRLYLLSREYLMMQRRHRLYQSVNTVQN